jgi:hypothetical protein
MGLGGEAYGLCRQIAAFAGREEKWDPTPVYEVGGGEEVRGRLRPLAGITGDDVVGRLGDCGGSGCFEALREAAGAGGFGVRGGDSFDLGEGMVLMAAGDA